MKATLEPDRARRYLLGEATDEECADLELEYFGDEAAIDRIAAVEDDLIEDYLAGQLTTTDRAHFEQRYLSVPAHQIRVETVRRLLAESARPGRANAPLAPAAAPKRFRGYGTWLAMAASFLVAASAAFWLFGSSSRRGPVEVANNGSPAPSTPATPDRSTPAAPAFSGFALTLPPVTVRGGSESPGVIVPTGTTIVTIHLGHDPDGRNLTPRRALIRTVGGQNEWAGGITSENNPPPGTIARIDVPATALPPEDHLIILYGTNAAGGEVEWAQYFLRVRGR